MPIFILVRKTQYSQTSLAAIFMTEKLKYEVIREFKGHDDLINALENGNYDDNIAFAQSSINATRWANKSDRKYAFSTAFCPAACAVLDRSPRRDRRQLRDWAKRVCRRPFDSR